MGDIFSLKEVERLVERVAAKFSIDGADFEDLVQIGRIAVWKVSEKFGVNEANAKQNMGLFYRAVEHALLRELKTSKAQKRLGLSRADSLDEHFSNEDDRTLHDVLPSSGESALDAMLNREKAEAGLKKLQLLSVREKTPESKRAVVKLLVYILGTSEERVPKEINYHTFVRFGLQRWLWVFFNNSPFRAVNFAYPGKFLPYHMARVTNGYWNGKRGKKKAIKALADALAKTGHSPEYYPKLLTNKFFEEFRLAYPLFKIFKWDRFAYLDAVFPGKYHPWEFSITPRRYFDKVENVIKATKWLVEEKLGYNMNSLTIEDVWRTRIADKITKNVFCAQGLREIIAIYKSPESAMRLAYPNKFLPWSFQRKGKWMGEGSKKLAAEATRWLIEKYAKVSPQSTEIGCNFFRKNGLWGMLTAKNLGFNTSPRAALINAYPDLAK